MNPGHTPSPGDAAATLPHSQAWQAAREHFFLTGDPAPVLQTLTQATDAIVVAAFTQAATTHPPQAPLALLAIGNYARGLTFPYSSADLLLLAELEPPPAPLLDAFTRQLWAQGLRLNCHTRTLGTVAALAPENRGLLLAACDRRLLSGPPPGLAALQHSWEALVASHGARLRRELAQTTHARHAEFHHIPRALAPDLKRGPGGLDDLQLLHRLRQLGGSHTPARDLSAPERLLSQARCYLHFSSGGNQNRLDSSAAAALAAPPFGTSCPAFLGELYHATTAVWREASAALASAADAGASALLGGFYQYRSQLSNADFSVQRDQVSLRQPSRLAAEPALAEQLLEFIARHGLDLAPDAAQRLEAAHEQLRLHWSLPAARWACWDRLLALPRASRALRALDAAALLPLLLPAWSRLEDWALELPERQFTSGEHALRTIEAAEALQSARPEDVPAWLRPWAQLPPEHATALALALTRLLADAHPDINPDTGLDAAFDSILVPAPIRERILAWHTRQPRFEQEITKRDLSEATAGYRLAELAGSLEDLDALVLLIHARWTARPGPADATLAWRIEQLGAAYNRARAALTQTLATERIDTAPSLPAPPEFLRGFPARYLRVHAPADLQAHVQLYHDSRATGTAARLTPAGAAYRLDVIAPDRPGLFASFAGALASFGMNILQAEAFANRAGAVLDTFVFADPHHILTQNPSEAERLTGLFRRVGLGKTDARRLLRGAPAPSPRRRAAAQVRFEDIPASASTLIEIDADDRSGLLYALASAIADSGCDIHVVLIDTRAGRAHDVFYAAHDGRPLSAELQLRLREQLLDAC